MPERRLILLRHGQTAWNLSGRAQGHADISLDETGHAQARAVAPVLATFEPVLLWSSDLARARETAAYVGETCGLTPVLDPRLREYDVGARSGLTIAEFAEQFPEEHAAWLVEDQSRLVPGEDSTAQVRDRVVPALRECWDALGPSETGVVVLHGACLMVGMVGLLGLPWEVARALRGMENCGFALLTEHPLKGGIRLASYNEKAPAGRHGPDFATDGPVG